MNWSYRLALWSRCKLGLHNWEPDYFGPWFFRCARCKRPFQSGPGAMALPKQVFVNGSIVADR